MTVPSIVRGQKDWQCLAGKRVNKNPCSHDTQHP